MFKYHLVTKESANVPTFDETMNERPRIRVCDFASLDLFGRDQNFIGRIVLNDHRDACVNATASVPPFIKPESQDEFSPIVQTTGKFSLF